MLVLAKGFPPPSVSSNNRMMVWNATRST